MEITEEIKRRIWSKGLIDEKYPSDIVRKDACGAFMLYEKFGDRNSIFGWEIDHIYPASELRGKEDITDDMIDDIINLRPLNWRNNASKSNSYPFYSASLVADDNAATNVETNIGKVVNEGVQAQLKDFYHLED